MGNLTEEQLDALAVFGINTSEDSLELYTFEICGFLGCVDIENRILLEILDRTHRIRYIEIKDGVQAQQFLKSMNMNTYQKNLKK